MTDKQWGKSVAALVAKVVLVVVIGLSVLYGMYVVLPGPTPTPDPNFTDLVQISLKGVVYLETPGSTGSGFVVGPRLIVTARHVVEGIEDFAITTADGHQLQATRAISDKKHDVGFIFVDDLTCIAEERGILAHDVVLHPLRLGNIAGCVLGQDIYIAGSPFGKVNLNAVSRGIISGLDRDWDSIDPYARESYGWAVAFTSDSSASHGNSGGPVFTMQGLVIGVLVGGRNSTVNCIMPVDLFIEDLDSIRLMFKMDRYEREEVAEYEEYDGYDAHQVWWEQWEQWERWGIKR